MRNQQSQTRHSQSTRPSAHQKRDQTQSTHSAVSQNDFNIHLPQRTPTTHDQRRRTQTQNQKPPQRQMRKTRREPGHQKHARLHHRRRMQISTHRSRRRHRRRQPKMQRNKSRLRQRPHQNQHHCHGDPYPAQVGAGVHNV